MTTTYETIVHDLFSKTLSRVHLTKKPHIFSYVRKLKQIDPHLFYKNGSKIFQGERFFWKDSNSSTYLVGLGAAYTIRTDEKETRFEEIDTQWKRLTEEIVLYNPYENIIGTGPLLLGGFAYDHLNEPEEEWSHFSKGLFQLPTFMLSKVDDEYFLTINLFVSPLLDENELRRLDEMSLTLLEGENKEVTAPTIYKATEKDGERWKQLIADLVDEMNEDSTFKKVVMARKMKLMYDQPFPSDVAIERLLERQYDSFVFSLEALNSCFLGATPERLVKKKGDQVYSTCLAGSIGRGHSLSNDNELGEELLHDKKNQEEHQLVVDVIASTMSSFCRDVSIPSSPKLLKMKDIQHLFTPVTGTLDGDYSLIHMVGKFHPTPALGGVPRERAMNAIRDKEEMDRGFYAAPIGWIDYNGNGDFAVAIRSGLLYQNEAYLYSGCGVLKDSTPESEYEETSIKFRPMLRALGGMKE
ncbi:isochorismate synthase [Bacillus coahuilensis]|uniref:isochorismate synthase n=1 Tax=Bacillus coahuilensis TaxID=408580 RepID=UPI00075031E9|nr:isochorismate synthase [Bacillus coahuilensis]